MLPVLGSRGDAQPAILLARELKSRGHRVVLTLPPNLVDFASRLGVTAQPLGPDFSELLRERAPQQAMRSGPLWQRWNAWQELAQQGWQELAEGLPDLAAGCDAVLTGVMGQEVGYALAQRHGLAQAALHFCPLRPSRSVPMLPRKVPGVRRADLLAGLGVQQVWTAVTRAGESRLARKWGLPGPRGPLASRMAAAGALELQAYDPALFPGLEREWGMSRPFVGFLGLTPEQSRDVDGDIPPEVASWLSHDDPVVYIGFGSMPVSDPEAVLTRLEQLCQQVGMRALISAGWAGLTTATPSSSTLLTGALPHVPLFPLVRATVHHGGAGSTAASLRAGCPTLITWVSADQPMWARAISELGAGVGVPLARLGEPIAEQAWQAVLREETATASKRLATTLIPPSEALRQAANYLEDHVNAYPFRSPNPQPRHPADHPR